MTHIATRIDPRLPVDLDAMEDRMGIGQAEPIPQFLRERGAASPPAEDAQPMPPPGVSETVGEQAANATMRAELIETDIRAMIERVEKVAAELRTEGLDIIAAVNEAKASFTARVDSFLATSTTLQEGVRGAWNAVAQRGQGGEA